MEKLEDSVGKWRIGTKIVDNDNPCILTSSPKYGGIRKNMPQPKKKTSHQKQHSRRANWKLTLSDAAACPNCGAPKMRHTACAGCGYYRGRPARRAEQVR